MWTTSVTPRANHIDALKKAVKAELELQYRSLIIGVPELRVETHDGTPCVDVGAEVEANTPKTAYKIMVAQHVS
jgi:hypothetical protein